ncbi:hypothetical protein PMAYCL1PPCAC_06808 [Pristionchus mayeri]|uniref:Nucleoprotein TPR/MLP1 domain-containing protein n=1 Tax=Pristionchus mayeri TaxID=1317129 RepID=A0AAN4ZDP5_9BILA|nr:hypothetical protein PMAYCL1PPCAC_06808 [Pristionchus mayeri]
MEVDPTSVGDVGGSGDATTDQPAAAPANNQSNDVELLKKEKAELETEIFTVKAQLEEITDKFLATTQSNEAKKEEYDRISRQFEERVRLFRDLQVTNESILAQKGAVDAECLSFKRDRDEKELLLKRVNKEKQLIAVEVQSLKEQLKDLNNQKKDLEMDRRSLQKAQNDARMECQRAIDEKAVYEESKRWFMNELTDRDNKIARLRLEHSGREVSWQNERIRLVDEKSAALNEVEDIKMDLALKQRLLDEANEKMKGIGESHDAQLTTLKEEVASRECLIRTLKDQINRADEACNEVKALYDNTAALLTSANEEIERARVETAAQIEDATRIIEEKDREVTELKDELEKANELIKNKHNLTITDEAIEELSPAAAVASRLIKSGGSLTAIYREHAKLAAQLEEERAKSRLTEESFQEVIGQLTERAPQLILQKEQLEKYMDESYRLENQLKEADEQRRQLMEERDWASRELAFTKGELEKCQRDSDLLSEKVSKLVFVLEKERRRSDRATPEADDENEEEDERIFRDIKSLAKRNQELESELSEEKARAHQLARAEVEEATERLTKDRTEMQRDLEMQRAQAIKLENALAGKQQALESYKNIVEGGGLGGENAIAKRQLEQRSAELNDANLKLARLEEWRASEKEEKEKLMNVYEERIKQHITIVSEVKRLNGKMESELELQKQTALETYKELEKQTRKLERAVENEQKARESVAATEEKVAGLHEKLMTMQGELSALRVERRSLDEQLKMSQSSELRLKAELEARIANNYHNEMMVKMMAEMEARVNSVESSKKEVMEMRVESLENERDQLKTSNAALAERNERLERERGAEVAKLSAEKVFLEAQLNTERNERITSESETNELRAKLVATQKHFTAVDDSLGTNPERLAQECQKLKNDNKFLEGQMEELKKRAEVADASAKRSEDELKRLTALSSTVETTLVDTTKAGSLEQERLKGLLEAEQMKANNLYAEMNRLKEATETLEKSAYEAKSISDNTIISLEQKINVLEMHLREESEKGAGFDERMKIIKDEKTEVMGQLNEVNEHLMVVKGEMEELKIEKEAAMEKVGVFEEAMRSLETRVQEESNRWIEEKMKMEGEYERLKNDNDGQRSRFDEEMKRKEEQINRMMSMAREMDGSSMEVDGMNQMSAVNRYLREEKQMATERMMRAEVEWKRVKVHNEELEEVKMRLEKRVKDLEAKSEADGTALADMADLRVKLEISMKAEKELVVMREEKERLAKLTEERQGKLNMVMNEKTKLMGEMNSLKESAMTMTNESATRMKEITILKKNIQEKENELTRVRAELAKKSAEPAPVGGPRALAQLNQLKGQLETATKEVNESREKISSLNRELEAANAKAGNLRTLALKYKKEKEDLEASSSGTTAETGENQNAANEGTLSTPPSNLVVKKLQEEKEELDAKLNAMTAEKEAIEGERDEIKFRLSSMTSLLEKAQKQRDVLVTESAELKRRLAEVGEKVEASRPPSAVASPSKNVSSPTKSALSISSASVSQSTPDASVPIPMVTSVSPRKGVESGSGVSTATLSAPSDPVPPSTSTHLFTAAPIEWPDKMSRGSAASTTSGGAHPPLFGRSRVASDVSTSSGIPERETTSFVAESKGEEEQPISSSGDSRKRGATDERIEMKRARIDEDEDEGANDVITSSHRGNEVEDVMVEEDTRDGEGEGEEERKEEELPVEEPIEGEEEESQVFVVDDEEEEGAREDDDVVEVDGEENEEDGSQRDDEMEDPEDEDVMEMRRGRMEEGVDDDDDDEEEGEDEEEDDEDGAISDDDEDEEDEEEMDGGSESDGEVEGDGETLEGAERDEGREAVASMDEADEEGGASGENPSAKSESSEGERKKRSPIVWSGAEQEECSSSNESGRPSTSAWRGPRGRGGVAQRGARVPDATDMATKLMRLNRGRGGGRGGKRGGPGN